MRSTEAHDSVDKYDQGWAHLSETQSISYDQAKLRVSHQFLFDWNQYFIS